MCAIFIDVWKWSQPGLQQVEKLAMSLKVILSSPLKSHWKFLSVSWGWPSVMERNLPWSGLSVLIDWSLDSPRECHSSQSFYCLYTKHLPEDSRRSQQADLLGSVTLPLSDTFLMFSTIPFFTVPSAQTTTTFSVFLVVGLCTCFSFRFPSVRCFYLME